MTPDQLANIQARADAATEGPWDMAVSSDRRWALVLVRSGTEAELRVARTADDDDAAFIAHARTDVPALLALVLEQQAQIERVRALHKQVLPVNESVDSMTICDECERLYPCPTIAALTATEGTE